MQAEQMNIPEKFEVVLPVDEETRKQLTGGTTAVSIAQSFEIGSHEEAQLAADRRNQLTRQIKQFEEMRKSLVAPAMKIVESARGIFNPTINGLEQAKNILGNKLQDWNRKEERRIAEENRQREEQARRARQEAERKASEERARAEAAAEAARREQAEAEIRRKAAEAEGNKRAAAAAAAAAARAREKEAAAAENAEAKAQEAQLNAAAVVEASRPQQSAKVSGFTTRENWIAELAPKTTEQDAIRQIAGALQTRPELVSILKLDMSAAKKLAKALKGSFSVPGLVAKNDPIPTGTKSK